MPPQIVQYISDYSYLAIFLLIYLQEIGVPIPLPNELLMLFAGYLSYKGILFFFLVLLTIIGADFTGTMTLYLLFYFFGNYLMAHKPKWIPLSTATLDRLEVKVTKGGWWAVFLFRITPFIRGYTSVASGLLRLKPKWFIPIACISSVLVCTTYVTLGEIFGPYWNEVVAKLNTFRYEALAVVLLIISIYSISKLNTVLKEKKKIKEKLQYEKERLIRLHMVSETAWVTQGQGVHTAYIELMELLAGDRDIILTINGKGKGNVFHSHTYGPYYFWKGRNYKGRRILTAHVIPDSSKGTIPFWKQLLPLTSLYLKLVYSFADVVIAISPTVEKAIKDLGVKSDIIRIHNPVLTENWARTIENRKKGRELLGIKLDEKLILGVGQLQERKGVEDFIDMAAAMPNHKFVWVGGRPWGMFTEGIQRINNRIENAPSNIFFTGLKALEDMSPMYAAADVFLFPSYQENCPLAPLEAAAAGLPVVFRDIPEYTSLYTSPYLKAADTNDFIRITHRLLADSSFYEESVQISAKLITEFDKIEIKTKLIDLYKQTLQTYYAD
ncbi:MAG: 1,2-diacylglycerol-3-alpha-glucose alpha,2-galactosyltransferase [Mucilaginibacter sp.]|uniref:glycosyltransferase n=1 Tax=Mucilaginibacter sp. TaxID=1882438 RepID=UPI002632A9C9|nr:glycosyltransferase [Mucilaginibacter sp.]MDB5004171.1 1,2-diacylglycerol-3-alpha-glucose alpha,2-galactosyltransferase [Mucilaginibacter sp.]